jgi:hypothetical protein
MATAILAPHQVDHTLVPHHPPRTTLALSTAAAHQVTHLRPDSHMAKGMEAKDTEARDTEAMALNNTLHSHSRDTVMAHKLVSVDNLVMVDQLPATAKAHHRQALVVMANKLDTEVLRTEPLPVPTAAQETTITTSTISMVAPQHTKTNTEEANSTPHHLAKQAAMAVHKVTTHLNPAGSKP